MKLIPSDLIISAIIALLFTGFLRAAPEIPRLHDEYDPAKWPPVELELQQAGTLKDIFDSGLRPYRFPGLEETTLEIKHLSLVLTLASGKSLPVFSTEVLRIKLFTDGEIATLEGFTPRLTLEQARDEMLRWLPYGTNGRTEKNLDDFLKAVSADFANFDDPYGGVSHGCSVHWKEPRWKEKGGGPQVVVWFRKAASPTHPLLLFFKVDWSSNRFLKDSSTLHSGPISPPSGYESANMTAPKKIGPDSAVEILRSQGVDLGESPEAMAEQRRNGERPPLDPPVPEPPLSNSNTPTAVPPAPEPFSWLPVAFVLAGLIILALMVRALRTDKEG